MIKRISELDFLKCIFILLMIAFHLVYIGDSYPYIKNIVYTFHIPAFLIISGYLMNIEKPLPGFLKTIFWLTVPYLIMESGYIVSASFLPIREHINNLTLDVFINKLFLKPIGPYWYLHTMIICYIVSYLFLIGFKSHRFLLSRIIVSSLVLCGLSVYLGIISLSSVFYFLLGFIIRQSSVDFLSFFKSSWMSIVGFLVLIIDPDNLDRFTIGGILITYLAISALLAIYKVLPRFISSFLNYIGNHSLLLFLFSPLFTILVKPLVGILSFDSSGLIFLIVSLIINIGGCFSVGMVIDYLGITPFIFGKSRIVESFR